MNPAAPHPEVGRGRVHRTPYLEGRPVHPTYEPQAEIVARLLAELTMESDTEPPTVADPPPMLSTLSPDMHTPTPDEWAWICDRVADLLMLRRPPHRMIDPRTLAPTPDAAGAPGIVDHDHQDVTVAAAWYLGLDLDQAAACASRILRQAPTLTGRWTWGELLHRYGPEPATTGAAPIDWTNMSVGLDPDEIDRLRAQVEKTHHDRP